MKFGVVVFPGSNCDDDMIYVLSLIEDAEVEKLWHKEKSLKGYTSDDCIVVPGGFAYGDYLRSGAIARFSPIMKAVTDFADRGGSVIGICNGFQVLCEAGLLPGTLLRNEGQKFISKNVYLRVENTESKWTNQYSNDEILKMPAAHAEGRYYCQPDTYEVLLEGNQILFRYCNKDGEVNSSTNLNGSLDNIAGICNKSRNVFGMMPHPERAAEKILGNDDGMKLFTSFVQSRVTKM